MKRCYSVLLCTVLLFALLQPALGIKRTVAQEESFTESIPVSNSKTIEIYENKDPKAFVPGFEGYNYVGHDILGTDIIEDITILQFDIDPLRNKNIESAQLVLNVYIQASTFYPPGVEWALWASDDISWDNASTLVCFV